jgi:N-acetylglucosamine malate deacetylase 2
VPRTVPLDALLRRRLAILAAHPDDETIGAGALLARRGRAAALIHVTDGAPRDMRDAAAHGFPTRASYAAERRAELTRALETAGVAIERVVELGAADQEAPHHLAPLARRLADLLAETAPEMLLTHPYEGGHPDHDAACFLAHAACAVLRRSNRPVPLLVEMTSYHARDGSFAAGAFLPDGGTEATTLLLDEAERALKRRLLDCFATQRATLAGFPLDVERFRPAPAYRFERPPHDGALYYEGFPWGMTGARWRGLAAAALADLGVPAAR